MDSIEKLIEFLRMGHYGIFIWPSYGAAGLILGFILFVSLRSLRRTQRRMEQLNRHEA